MLMAAFGAALVLVALLRSARGFALGGLVVFFTCMLQPDHGFALGFLNKMTDTVVVMTAYATIGLAILMSTRMHRTMKAFSRS